MPTEEFNITITIDYVGKSKGQILQEMKNMTLYQAWIESKKENSNVTFQFQKTIVRRIKTREQRPDTLDE